MKDGEINRSLNDKKIMIIDECKAFREMISSICTLYGASVITSDNTKELFFQAIIQKPDLIIFHPGSEKRIGLYACKVLKRHAETRHIPLLLTTGDHSLSAYTDKMFKFDDYILKPFLPEELVHKMEKLLIKGNEKLIVD